jgi:hypothetical protein
MEGTKKTTLYLPLEVAATLKRIAEGNRRSFNSEVVVAVEEHIRKEEKRMTTDRRAGSRQGPYVSGGKLPRARNNDGTWRKKRSDAGTKRSTTATKRSSTTKRSK